VAGNLASEVEDFEHGGAFADNTVEFEVFEELLLQRADAAALIVEGGNFVEGALQAGMIDRFGEEIGGAAANGLESVVQGVIGGHDDEVDAGIAAERAVKKLKGSRILHMNAGQDEAGASRADETQSFLGVASGDGLIAYVRNQRGERIALEGFVVKNARGERGVKSCDFYRFISCVSHDQGRGNKCAKRDAECFAEERQKCWQM
jgi:hypothetical protein